ncbi:hypothetical protein KIPB_003898, partial [Kipferlia bialata]|eukprot:g3898.t1
MPRANHAALIAKHTAGLKPEPAVNLEDHKGSFIVIG